MRTWRLQVLLLTSSPNPKHLLHDARAHDSQDSCTGLPGLTRDAGTAACMWRREKVKRPVHMGERALWLEKDIGYTCQLFSLVSLHPIHWVVDEGKNMGFSGSLAYGFIRGVTMPCKTWNVSDLVGIEQGVWLNLQVWISSREGQHDKVFSHIYLFALSSNRVPLIQNGSIWRPWRLQPIPTTISPGPKPTPSLFSWEV